MRKGRIDFFAASCTISIVEFRFKEMEKLLTDHTRWRQGWGFKTSSTELCVTRSVAKIFYPPLVERSICLAAQCITPSIPMREWTCTAERLASGICWTIWGESHSHRYDRLKVFMPSPCRLKFKGWFYTSVQVVPSGHASPGSSSLHNTA